MQQIDDDKLISYLLGQADELAAEINDHPAASARLKELRADFEKLKAWVSVEPPERLVQQTLAAVLDGERIDRSPRRISRWIPIASLAAVASILLVLTLNAPFDKKIESTTTSSLDRADVEQDSFNLVVDERADQTGGVLRAAKPAPQTPSMAAEQQQENLAPAVRQKAGSEANRGAKTHSAAREVVKESRSATLAKQDGGLIGGEPSQDQRERQLAVASRAQNEEAALASSPERLLRDKSDKAEQTASVPMTAPVEKPGRRIAPKVEQLLVVSGKVLEGDIQGTLNQHSSRWMACMLRHRLQQITMEVGVSPSGRPTVVLFPTAEEMRHPGRHCLERVVKEMTFRSPLDKNSARIRFRLTIDNMP